MGLPKDGSFRVVPCPMIGSYNVQRFPQWSPEDCANFYLVKSDNAKKPYAMYPIMGRQHLSYLGSNILIFSTEPRGLFKTIDYAYIVEGNTVYQIDDQWNQVAIGSLNTISGRVYFAFLVVNTIVYACFVDSQKIYIYQESGGSGSLEEITDPNAPGNFTIDGALTKPGYIGTFGYRLVVSVANSSQFVLSATNLVGTGTSTFDPALAFTTATGQVFAQAGGIIRQMGVLNNTLYIFSDYQTDIWSNSPSRFSGTGVQFPFQLNSSYNWNFGIANPTSLDINFGYIFFLARNSDGLLQFMASKGGQPEKISSKAVDTMLQNYTNTYGINNPFLLSNSNGFLYQYENTILYRMSGGPYTGTGLLDQTQGANSIEFSLEGSEWHRCIELNGERNRVQNHVYFNFKHLVTVVDDGTVYELSGQFYTNDIRNPDQADEQETDAFIPYPFRYERTTPIIYDEDDYSELETEYLQIDFVFGDSNINFSSAPFANAEFIIDEELDADGNVQFIIDDQSNVENDQIFIITEEGNTPGINADHYNTLYKPSIELFFSNDSGISFQSADVREFSQMGVYQWRMRWYQLGASRNRVYKLVCVSPVPVVILGAVMNMRRISGGAN